jgi:hypothetical protein
MTRFSLPVTLGAVALALLGMGPRPAAAQVGATGDGTFTQDVLHASGYVVVEFSEYG